MSIREKIIEILGGYEGKISCNEQEIILAAYNLLDNKKIKCFCEIYFRNGWIAVGGYESTHSIIGGHSCPCYNDDDVIHEIYRSLNRYNFIEKGVCQLKMDI